jgi:hypothetical protein
MSEQLGLWETEDERSRRKQGEWNRMRREFRLSQGLVVREGDYGPIEQDVCLRCGQVDAKYSIFINHDAGWTGCPVEHDPTWSQLPPREDGIGSRGYSRKGRKTGHMTDEEMVDRWEVGKLPPCECGHPFGLHSYGTTCYLYCGCRVYEASAPTTTH